jgi:branched-chain amino acid transport system substrate-binding protein
LVTGALLDCKTVERRRKMRPRQIVFLMMAALALTLHNGLLYAGSESKVVVDKWEIPFINCMTGPAAGIGAISDYFQKAAVEEINAAGGIAGKPIVIQDCDTAMDPTRAASCMKRAVEKSLVALGPMASLDAQVCAPIAAKNKVMCLPVAGGWEIIKDSRPWAVVLIPPHKTKAEFDMNSWIDRNSGIKKVVMLGVPNIPQWKFSGVMQAEVLEKRGIKVLDNIDVAPGAVDVSAVSIRALKSKPDGIVIRLYAADTVRVVSELQKRGFANKERIWIHASADVPELFEMSGEKGNVMDGVYIGTYSMPIDAPEYQKLLDGFRKLKGQGKATKLMFADSHYVSTMIVKDAIEKNGITGDPAKLEAERVKIRDFINTLKDYNSKIWGPISALPDGSFSRPLCLAQIKNNKPTLAASSKDYFKK